MSAVNRARLTSYMSSVLKASDEESGDRDHDHEPETEDIADGVVGGGAAHVFRTYCRLCNAELETEEPEHE